MAHESFEDPAAAKVLNADFISIKVDREERPDVDETYMTAIQLTSGRGGWPMTVFMTPDRRPFLAATYIPKNGRDQQPGFVDFCRQISHAWKTRREEVERVADEIAGAIQQTHGQPIPRTSAEFGPEFLDRAVEAMLTDFDPQFGGFGPPPKFPPHTTIDFLMAYAVETAGPDEVRDAAATAAIMTLRQMCLGGIHDHVGGGFHRYSTDERWLLPHFEKMLTDNALMLSNLARAQLIASPVSEELAEVFRAAGDGIVTWLLREMTSPEGLFFTAIDADSEGEEGRYYVWREDEVRAVLAERADAFLKAFGFEPDGNYYDEATGRLVGTNIPHREETAAGAFASELALLQEARTLRIPPGIDGKVLISANGLMIAALAENGMVELAARAADAILAAEKTLGRLPHQIVGGRPEGDAFLDGYACFTDALLRLADIAEAFIVEGEPLQLQRTPEQYREEAARIGGQMIARFYDDSEGGFFFSSERHQALFGRSKPMVDQPIPSPNAVGLRVLIAFGAAPRVFQTRDAVLGLMERAPQATAALHEAMLALQDETIGPMLSGFETEPEPAIVVGPGPLSPGTAAGMPSGAVLQGSVVVTLSARELVAGADGTAEVQVRISIPDGFHINSNDPPARWLTPTRIEVRPIVAKVAYPSATDDRFTGEVLIPVRLTLPPGSSGEEFELKVSYQACTEESCLLPAEKVFEGVLIR
jgi:uncharacterized protein YyaL (SSP411 family)